MKSRIRLLSGLAVSCTAALIASAFLNAGLSSANTQPLVVSPALTYAPPITTQSDEENANSGASPTESTGDSDGSSVPLPDGAPPAVANEYDRIIAHGGTVKGVSRFDYHEVDSGKVASQGDTSDAPPAAVATPMTSVAAARNYPTGCGLFVLVYKRSHYIYSSSLTQCNLPVTEIQMYGTVVREHWFGIEELRDHEDEATHTDHLVLRLRANCANSGSYFYQASTNGWLEWNGTEYETGAYDRTESSVNC